MRKKSAPPKKATPKRKPEKSVTRSEQNPAAVDVKALLNQLQKPGKGKKRTRGR